MEIVQGEKTKMKREWGGGKKKMWIAARGFKERKGKEDTQNYDKLHSLKQRTKQKKKKERERKKNKKREKKKAIETPQYHLVATATNCLTFISVLFLIMCLFPLCQV